MTTPNLASFLCSTAAIIDRIECIDPLAYARTRNYLDGSVTWLSPFLTHGIIQTTEIAQHVLQKHQLADCYKLLYELAWREYFHRAWQHAGEDIFNDIRNPQVDVSSARLPLAILDAATEIDTLDRCLQTLFSDGVMHNHARLWVAAIVCNLAKTHWLEPARFLHYHLLDGDLASNTLSWQWVAGTFSHKQYVVNQDNINKYSRTDQHNTWLDLPYQSLQSSKIPPVLQERADVAYNCRPFGEPISPVTGTIALRSLWQLDPRWQSNIEQHMVFVDTDWLSQWPLSTKRIVFIEHWVRQCNATLTFGTLDQLKASCREATVVREEYPACSAWPGAPKERAWLYPETEKPLSSFSYYFKQVKASVGV